MVEKTNNFNLTKPSVEEFYDINVHNENMDIIDEELKILFDKSDDVDGKLKTLDDSKSDFEEHKTASNPHNMTASVVGLGNVPNVSTNDQTPTYSEAGTLAKLTSGEKMSIAFGKIAKAITDFITHKSTTGTSSVSGHLKITDSKTSTATDTAASAKALKEVNDAVSLQLKVATGSYNGSGVFGVSNPSSLVFDFTPKLVILHSQGKTTQYKTGFVWMPGMTQIRYVFGGSSSASDLEITIALNGKTLTWYSTNSAERQMNHGSETYHYIAFG